MSDSRQLADRLFGKIGQERRLLKLDTPLGVNTLLPQRAHGFDRIGKGFDYTVDLLSLDADIELKQLIAQEVTLWTLQTDAKKWLMTSAIRYTTVRRERPEASVKP